MDRMDKRAALEDRRNRWMADREAALAKTSTTSVSSKPIVSSPEPPPRMVNDRGGHGASPRAPIVTQTTRQPQHSYVSQSVAPAPANDEEFIDKLTAKLARNFRDEVRKELQMTTHSVDVRDAIAEQMSSYLEAELGTHTCKLCNKLMVSPNNTPILLFPCGHTFCKACTDGLRRKTEQKAAAVGRVSQASYFTCPYCRADVQSVAVNQSLKELIDQFAKQRAMVASGSAHHLEDIFPPGQDGNRSLSSGGRSGDGMTGAASWSGWAQGDDTQRTLGDARLRGNASRSSGSGAVGGNNKYAAQLRNCTIRFEIMKNEYHEAQTELASVQKRQQALRQASAHLLSERDRVEDQIKLLIEERDLIDKHLVTQQAKQREIETACNTAASKVETLKQTTDSLQGEIEKLEILAANA